MATIRKNERSWGIELITQINQFAGANDLMIKRAGGESTISETKGKSMFPDVILYGDNELSSILQGWELKMPDVPITDETFVNDAQRKAKALSLNSCVIWNFTHAKLYVFDDKNDEFEVKREWHNRNIKTRNDVQLYKDIWENTLKSVLTSVNEYLVSGDLKKTFIGEVLTKTSVATLVNEHKACVADALRKTANGNAVMEAFIDNWWKGIKTEYEGDETNKYSAYAKNVVINWANRIIFAHLIKRRQQSAFAIDSLNYTNTPYDGNQIFKEITKKSDFYNIFGRIEYDEFLPKQTWTALVELSLILKDSPIRSINQHILQQVLEGSVNISKRLVNGQYPTPPILARILAKITIHNPLGECLDGCCGTGTIPNYIINFKKDRMGASMAMATTWACDKFKLPLQIANLAMTCYDTIDIPCRLFQHDILTLLPGDEVEIVNPKTGEKETYKLPVFDAIVSNLPFVKSSEISEEHTAFIRQMKRYYGLSGRSDFSYYIALHLRNLVKVGGYVGIILSNSFLGTEAGNRLMTAIREYFDDIKIHASGNGRWFDNADIVTALLVMRKKAVSYSNNSISFFTWKRNRHTIETNKNYEDIIVNTSLLDQEIDSSIVSRVNYSDSEIEELKRLNVSYNSLFTNLKWLLEISYHLVPLDRYFKVFRGSRRGWDDMFFPEGDTGIEPVFLKDVLMNARSTDRYIATTDRKAFCCNLTIDELIEGGFHGALAWIRKFQNEKNGVGKPLPDALKRDGLQWYELTTDEVAEIFTMMNPDNRMFYAKFNEPTFVNQRLIGLKRKRMSDDLDLLHALLNSILSLFYIEAVGFGRGLGVLDINKDSISKCYILSPAVLSDEQICNIKKTFYALIAKGIVDIEVDLADPIRQEFDMTVLDAYGIGRYYDTIVCSLKSMRRMRKAVKQSVISLNIPTESVRHESLNETLIGFAAEGDMKN